MGQLAAAVQAVPFIGVLLSFAIMPGLAPRIWHRRMGGVICFWVGLRLAFDAQQGIGAALRDLWQASFLEFLPFMALLLALYALGGGISMRGGPWGRPAGNALLLVFGTIAASLMGTIGASLLLIHPLLAANGHRHEKRHLVLAFIILVGNAGGALSPLGDPPLLVGYLHGVPFTWPLRHLWAPLLVMAAPVLALCTAADSYLARREARPKRRKFAVRGALNIALLLVLMAAIPAEALAPAGAVDILGARMPVGHLAVTGLAMLFILVSERYTPKSTRAHNRFAWSAMREITLLFFAIFATIAPAFVLLQQARLAPDPLLWFWASGIASAILDAAPTYLVFFQAAGGNGPDLAGGPARLLTALAAGSIFFGPVTYLGNAPNLMVREIAARRGVRMPGFFVYAGVMILLLAPLYLVMGFLFF